MQEIRIHGRGGQGSVTLAQLIAGAAFEGSRWAQAFPAFGVERRGAPVEAYVRLDEDRIRDRSQVTAPDYVIVQDTSLLDIVDVADGMSDDGLLLVNSTDAVEELELDAGIDVEVRTVDATAIAREHLGVPIANTSLLGAFAAATGLVEPEYAKSVVYEKFDGEIAEKNAAAIDAAVREVSA
ncbi:Pyruvate:ferredoxin oxidoreductase or related 2-oxoacid:ferredoxin oxidoreductase, gamma subunit [Halalkaliarchaeum sp. AArc-CO]|uniref:pyruvate ferredoxin oxidoreductase subunit gamma n=1 Tax=unclassified Halalkaliarchaeum TaxID=2678344 RepID=UPI00217D274B|nr:MULTISPECIES: pyruvate ferredoxin oxidoreductase subunit gamma [unclassified Halalkaliarchaeum]MDR5673123.1 pyruvate ferredoxin oxidoreductase subunit gamma [Halalkaliarchaeum sp. AArc-GB]UWG49587.1 Pyruvate:ferredoxin oxidoreductase or related 2-oxoacid:ferredoxin oxidoreductase, gamma subunit [Halalkaliarchaeum sp. AArc-CO]